jgi:hypothetical protein
MIPLVCHAVFGWYDVSEQIVQRSIARVDREPAINTTGAFALRNIERVTIHNDASHYGA